MSAGSIAIKLRVSSAVPEHPGPAPGYPQGVSLPYYGLLAALAVSNDDRKCSTGWNSEQLVSILLTIFLVFNAGCLLVHDLRSPNVVFTNEEMDAARACCFPTTEGVRMAIRR